MARDNYGFQKRSRELAKKKKKEEKRLKKLAKASPEPAENAEEVEVTDEELAVGSEDEPAETDR